MRAGGAQQTPVLHFPAPGIVDFGTATVGPLFGGDSRYGQLVLYFFGPGMGVSYDPLTPPSPFTNFATYYSCSNWSEGGGCEPPPSQPPAVDNASFRLVFPVQDTIQLSFSNLIGYEPAIAPPVPEPSTWIMMILGFTAFGLPSQPYWNASNNFHRNDFDLLFSVWWAGKCCSFCDRSYYRRH